MNNDRKMQHLWVFIIVSLALGCALLVFFLIQYYQYKGLSNDEKKHLNKTVFEMMRSSRLEEDGKVFVSNMLKSWSWDNYDSFIDRENLSDKERGVLGLFFDSLSRMYGSLEQCVSVEGKITLRGTSIKDARIHGEYAVEAMFQLKPKKVSFSISVVKDIEQNKWFLESFHGL